MTESQNLLGATTEPTETNQYLARDGLYYNGYSLSYDCAEDAFGECFERIRDAMHKELFPND